MAAQKQLIDREYNEALGAFLRGDAPSIAPNGKYRSISTPWGMMSIKYPKEWTKLSKQQRVPKR